MITALLAEDFLKQPENKGATIVYDLRSSHVVPDVIKAAGGVPKRDRVGHAFIKKTMAETQGGLRRRAVGPPLLPRQLLRRLRRRRVRACCQRRQRAGQAARAAHAAVLHATARAARSTSRSRTRTRKIRELADAYKSGQIDYLDGITIDLGDWWFNVRKSNTEPLLRLNLEAKIAAMLRGEACGAEEVSGGAGARALAHRESIARTTRCFPSARQVQVFALCAPISSRVG